MTTDIEWTDETWNPTTGCDRVSPGCRECYAATMARRLKAMGQPKYQNDGDPTTSGPGFKLTVHPDALDIPLRWKSPKRIFVDSMSDLFHPDVPSHFIASVWRVMAKCPQHTFQILTKRPQRMEAWVNANNEVTVPTLPNVWLGTSIENDTYTWRADHLRGTPAAVRFISAEPLLGPLPSLDLTGIDWLIAGGESGPGARPMHPDWVRDLRDRCVTASVAFHFKQWGSWAPWSADDWSEAAGGSAYVKPDGTTSWAAGDDDYCTNWSKNYEPGDAAVTRVGKKAAGRQLDGRTWDQFPTVEATA